MKLRANIVPAVCIVIGIATLLLGGTSHAQTMIQPPLMAPYTSPVTQGRLYGSLGVQWSQLWECKVTVSPNTTAVPDSIRLETQAWGPLFEVGYQASSFFDVFTDFSWYNLTGRGSMASATVGDFWTFNLDFTNYQLRLGSRSWTPLYGVGSFGTELGCVISVIPYQLDVLQTLNAVSGPASHDDTWFTGGGFLGLQFIGEYGNYFGQAKVVGTLLFGNNYDNLANLDVNVNTSGVAISLGGGVRF